MKWTPLYYYIRIMNRDCYYCPRNFYCNKNVCEIEIKERENLDKRNKHVFKL